MEPSNETCQTNRFVPAERRIPFTGTAGSNWNNRNVPLNGTRLKIIISVLGNCSHINIKSPSGVYKTETQEGKSLDLFCDTDTDDGPWTVIQRRTSGDVDFYRKWTDYKNGFGDLLGSFWIGNDNLHLLTTIPMILRVELEAWDGTRGYAQYSEFQVANEDQNYRLFVQGFSGNVSHDAMDYHSGQAFSTYDRDNDQRSDNCAMDVLGGWWYNGCYHTNLNGGYFTFNGHENSKAMDWWYFPSARHQAIPLKRTRMMIR
ncbi:angiopoietin-related protein 7-like [Pecten maximus]|uniref:angiopoietin-related protein 7-like n=1 Tax=Pecten maximus TaxID=6579 RepID=UPI001458A5DC|nr:angiopoietin-related protein 7-like [Pecten maximus]